ncbi:zinc finger protein Xfin-like isoform X3 [Anthonomus grandis grandis]|uniref:zinc finger protein Xfin-like isoform X3 n=1 Tax=Anthonomus grandis grandis TaxID=2921223 RepID=UPI002165E76B|nr:zinc finger protein Xfin-like isoform X3 [Anthonomus grandis grandis]
MESLINQALSNVVTDDKCSLCDVMMSNESAKFSHCTSQRHLNKINEYRLKVKRNLETLQAVQVPKVIVSPLMPFFKCSICNISHTSEEKLARHWSVNHCRIYPFYCPTCKIPKDSPESMFNHFKTQEHQAKSEGQWAIPFDTTLPRELNNLMLITGCNVCNKKFTEPLLDNALQHYKTQVHQSAVYRWSVRSTTSSLQSLDGSDDLQTSVFCYICEKNFLKSERNIHVKSFPHFELELIKQSLVKKGIILNFWSHYENGFLCKLCDAKITGYSQYEGHFNSVYHKHRLEEWIVSNTVTSFKFQPSFIERSKWFYCHICNKSLDGTFNALGHYTGTVHLGLASKYCNICGFNAISELSLASHKKEKHYKQSAVLKSTTFTSRESAVPCDISLPSVWNEMFSEPMLNQSAVCGRSVLSACSSLKSLDSADDLQTSFYCCICENTFSKSEKIIHVKSFPHSQLILIKQSLVKNGVYTNIWRKCENGFLCELCDAKIIGYSQYEAHFNSAHHKDRFDEWIASNTVTLFEIQSFFRSKWFYCHFCNKSLDGTSDALDHYKGYLHRGQAFNYCDICGFNSSSELNLKRHIKDKHYQQSTVLESTFVKSGESAVPCDISIPSVWNETFSEPMLNQRAFCRRSVLSAYSSFKSLDSADDLQTSFYCCICENTFLKSEKIIHVKSFPHSQLILIKQCLVKNEVFTNFWHECENGFLCELCDAKIIGYSQYEGHFNSAYHKDRFEEWIASNTVPSFEIQSFFRSKWIYCHVCNKSLDGTSDALDHYTSYLHRGQAFNYCDICGFNSSSELNFERHIKDKHYQQSTVLESTSVMFGESAVPCDISLPSVWNEMFSKPMLNQNAVCRRPVLSAYSSFKSLDSADDLQTSFYCYICENKFLKSEKIIHVKSFPHSQLILIKQCLVKNGVFKNFWHECENGFLCELCDAKIIGYSQYEGHFNSDHHKDRFEEWIASNTVTLFEIQSFFRSKWFYCHVCNKSLDGTSDTLDHYTGYLHRGQALNYCDICRFNSSSEPNLERHIKDKHYQQSTVFESTAVKSGQSAVPCDISLPSVWNETFSEPRRSVLSACSSLKSLDSADNLQTSFYCYICEDTFLKSEKIIHVKSFPHSQLILIKQSLVKNGVYTNIWRKCENGFLCELCDAKIIGYSQYEGHFNSAHHQDRFEEWIASNTVTSFDIQSFFRSKWFYCHICNNSLDGTSNALDHYTSSLHRGLLSLVIPVDLIPLQI